jgi:hypothetical protein
MMIFRALVMVLFLGGLALDPTGGHGGFRLGLTTAITAPI